MSKLRPCPFCAEAKQLYPGYRNLGKGTPYEIDCIGCGIEVTPREGMNAVEKWNNRPIEDALRKKLSVLLEAAKNLEDDDEAITEHAWDLLQEAIEKAEGEGTEGAVLFEPKT